MITTAVHLVDTVHLNDARKLFRLNYIGTCMKSKEARYRQRSSTEAAAIRLNRPHSNLGSKSQPEPQDCCGH